MLPFIVELTLHARFGNRWIYLNFCSYEVKTKKFKATTQTGNTQGSSMIFEFSPQIEIYKR